MFKVFIFLILIPLTSEASAFNYFSYVKSIHLSKGNTLSWHTKLKGSGRLEWRGSFTNYPKTSCSSEGGYFVANLNEKERNLLFEKVNDYSKRLKKEKKHRRNKKHRSQSLLIKRGKKITKHSAFKDNRLPSIIQDLIHNFISIDKNRAQILTMDIIPTKNEIKVRLSNTGNLPIMLDIPKHSRALFKIQRGKDLKELLYSSASKTGLVKLEKNKHVIFTFNPIKDFNKSNLKIHFMMKMRKHNSNMPYLSLCKVIK